MKRAILYVAFMLILLGGIAAPAQAQSQDRQAIRQLLEQRDRQIKQVLGDEDKKLTPAQRAKLKRLINGVIDFRAMAQTALGPHWDGLSSAKRDTFVSVFSEIVRAQSLSDVNVYRSDVTYDKIDVEGDSAYVVTTTVYKDVPTKVEYVLGYDEEEDAWRAHDIILDDVSTAQGYARSFQTVVRKRGFGALMKSLRKKLDKTNASQNS